jgi:hypothetical protein
MIELDKLPDSSLYRGFGMSATLNTKEKVIAEASQHGEVIWIESMAMAFVKEEEE